MRGGGGREGGREGGGMEHAARYVRMRMRGLKQDASSHQSNSSFFALKKIEEYSTYLKKMSHIYLNYPQTIMSSALSFYQTYFLH